MGKSSAPSAPNPTQTATAQTTLNDVNQSSPFGSLNYNQTGTGADGVPIMTATTSLSPIEQQLFNQQTGVDTSLQPAEQHLAGQIGQSNPALNPNNLMQQFSNNQGAAYNAQEAYLQPQQQQQTGQLKDSLAAQGITEASNPTAYNNAMQLNNNTQSFQNQEAFDNSYATGLAGEGQQFSQGVQESNLPLQQLQTLQNMTNVQTPSFGATPTTDLSSLVQNNYQQQLASYNNQQQGLFGLGGTGILGAAYALKPAAAAAAG